MANLGSYSNSIDEDTKIAIASSKSKKSVSGVVAARIDHALETAEKDLIEIERKLLLTFENLEETRDKEANVASIDFSSAPNYFEKLGVNVPKITLNFGEVKTKKVEHENFNVEGKSDNDTDFQAPAIQHTSHKYSRSEQELVSISHCHDECMRKTKSLTNISDMDKHKNDEGTRSEHILRCQNAKVSSHTLILKTPSWKTLKTNTVKSMVNTSIKKPQPILNQDHLWQQLDMLTEEVKAANCSALHEISQLNRSISGEHISTGIQVQPKEYSAFEAYVALKRELSKSGANPKELLDKERKYTYLKNVSVAEYMAYKDHITPTENQPVVPLNNSPEKYKLFSLQPNLKVHAKTLASTPSSSIHDLYNISSKQFKKIKHSVNGNRMSAAKPVTEFKGKELYISKHVKSSNRSIPITNLVNKATSSDFNVTRPLSNLNITNPDIIKEKTKEYLYSSKTKPGEVNVTSLKSKITLNSLLTSADHIMLSSQKVENVLAEESPQLVYTVSQERYNSKLPKLESVPKQVKSSDAVKFSTANQTASFGYQHSQIMHKMKPVVVPSAVFNSPESTKFNSSSASSSRSPSSTGANRQFANSTRSNVNIVETLAGGQTITYSTSARSKHMLALSRSMQ